VDLFSLPVTIKSFQGEKWKKKCPKRKRNDRNKMSGKEER
jgi:hypothetical protein